VPGQHGDMTGPQHDTDPDAALRDELADIEAELEQLRRSTAELQQPDGPGDSADISARLTGVEEQSALIRALEARRDEAHRKLGHA
jgi:hypothetical protein